MRCNNELVPLLRCAGDPCESRAKGQENGTDCLFSSGGGAGVHGGKNPVFRREKNATSFVRRTKKFFRKKLKRLSQNLVCVPLEHVFSQDTIVLHAIVQPRFG